MTLNGVIVLILLYFAEFDIALQAYYVTVVEDRHIVCRISSSTFDQN